MMTNAGNGVCMKRPDLRLYLVTFKITLGRESARRGHHHNSSIASLTCLYLSLAPCTPGQCQGSDCRL